jgi:hypothetical protein
MTKFTLDYESKTPTPVTIAEIVMWSIVAAYFAFLSAIMCWPSK